ncbi:hypothetical protein Fcan01_01117 [Folsomia candida]|uniref:Uncharacterized protein n=1 Tax=Folsomia candida TaxID=158441 RepID=A0A226EX88_FOLCA|nr:hypothetical protein Fcan01_01117 [Folsomia candida]
MYSTEQDVLLTQTESVIKKVSAWLENQFPVVMKKGTASKITSHSVSYVKYCCPQISPDSDQFYPLVRAISVALLIDFFVDDTQLFYDYDFNDLRDGFEVFKSLMDDVYERDLDYMDEEVHQKIFKMKEIHGNKFAAMLVGAAFELTNDSACIFGARGNSRKQAFFFNKVLESALAGLLFKSGDIEECSANTHRYLRSSDGTIAHMVNVMAVIRDAIVPRKVTENPIFRRFLATVDEISGAFNDILGLQKDIRIGEENGNVMYKVKRGVELQVALEEEISILKNNINDYMKLKEIIVKYFPLDKNLEEYFDITDSVLFGLFQVFTESEIYGMRDHIKISV